MRILVPVDFSTCSRAALAFAVRLAERAGGSIEVVHVWTVPAFVPLATGVTMDGYTEPLPIEHVVGDRATKQMDAFLASFRFPRGVHVASKIEYGSPLDVIVAEAVHHDVVVAGTHGRGALARFVLGSVANKIVRHCPRPVITTHEHGGTKLDRILATVDFSPASERGLEHAARFARTVGASFEVLHVVTPLLALEETNVLVMTSGLEHGVPYDRWARVKAEEEMQALLSRIPEAEGAPVRIEIGDPARTIADVAKAEGFDMIAMGTHGRTGLARLAIGSVAEKVVRHADCPVLTLRTH